MIPLNLRCDQVTLGDQLRKYIEERLDQALERIRERVQDIHLNIEDIKGPSIERRKNRHQDNRKRTNRTHKN
jgi:prefoldin subunit 5